jgi:endonuclease/exonuclease/phosphatase family metal-dependent hydrolase
MKNIFSSRLHWQLIIGVLLLAGACSNPTPTPEPPKENIYDACAPLVSSSSFDILSWNIEEFPIETTTTTEVANIILASNIDLVAFQEVSSAASIDALLAMLPGWEAKLSYSGSLNLGYLYKTEEVTITPLTTLYDDLWSPFPRPPVVTVATHSSGIEATLINLHLKCCGGANNVARRTEASTLLQQYIETEKPNDPVIIIGDFNDEITTISEPTPFQNFIDAPSDYKFVDMAIAKDESLGWSYPSWPSHIDHILITNELFDVLLETSILKFEECNSTYSYKISDHRPLLMRLEQ